MQSSRPTADLGDKILPFQIAETAVRGRVIRLGPAIDEILTRHPFEASVKMLIGETAALVAMMGSSLKFDGRLIFQVQGDGPVPMLVSDYAASGALRATASVATDSALDEIPAIKDRAPMRVLMGNKAHIVVTVDQGPDMERYQGVTPLDGATIAEAAVSYFDQSEQIPTAVKLGVGRIAGLDGKETWRAGGILAQFVPGEGGGRERGEAILKGPEEQELWDRAAALLETTQLDELLDPMIASETLLYRLFHEDGVRVFDPQPVRAECHCGAHKIEPVLSRYTAEDLADMAEDGVITVTCEFCRTDYRFAPDGALLAV
ncbi:MAG: Hsp33 family molecular chaperone [Pseudomonadota bacterium]